MRHSLIVFLCAAAVSGALSATAEVQNITVGGEIRIRANYYGAAYARQNEIRWPNFFLPARAIGDLGNNVTSVFAWSDRANDLSYTEERMRLNFKADFTDNVGAFVEFDNYRRWGTDFRSDYVTGADFASPGLTSDVEVYQAYIEANEMGGLPIRMRVGRQELAFGNEWLVGTNDTSSSFTGLSFDALRLTYGTDQFSVDAWAAKLVETGNFEGDGDVDFYGVYGTYKGIPNLTLDAYWMWVRDARSLQDSHADWFSEWLENWIGVDNYDVTNLHTVGLRGAGTIGAFDYNLEAAYQFGDAGAVGFRFKPVGTYGDDRAEFDGNWGANAEIGYTFDIKTKPRVYLGGAYLGGEDRRGTDFARWLSPFDRPRASVSFNRVFSNWEYSEFLENTELSNVWIARGGVGATPIESVDLLLAATYFHSLDEFEVPRYFRVGRYRVPILPNWSFWTQKNSGDLGLELELTATYHYSSDLKFNGGWAHLFVGDGLAQGNYNALNGLAFNGGVGNKDADYIFLEADLTF